VKAQFVNHYAGDRAFGLPIVFLIYNNHYGMTGRADDEVTGVRRLKLGNKTAINSPRRLARAGASRLAPTTLRRARNTPGPM
jgi:hypothetical protein